MQVAAGTQLGPYEIVAPLGAGGMGEVWRARDRRLERGVAIKILPAEFSTNAQLRLRLDREAKTISQLNHPNICTLYDVGHDSGTDFLVMELIEGESLADRISRGPMPLADVIRYGSEIAEALDKAHRSGIVHRDLKPGNVMLTKSGAKLLDFGLARTQSAILAPQASVVETQRKPLTEEGMIVGTFRYMSPEQLEGADVDHRSDIFALGALLYEMATGRRAFDGKSRTSLIAAIVSAEPPPLSQVRPLAPEALERLIRTCLAKDPDERMQSAHDVAVELRWIATAEETRPAARASWVPWMVAAVLAVALLAAVAVHLRTTTPPIAPIRFTIPPPPQTALNGIPAVSPDGRSIIFRTVSLDGPPMLWLRSLDGLEARPLKGTEGAHHVFWSPDGQRIGFMARNKMWRLDLVDGTVHALYEPVENVAGGGTWNDRDVILFSPRAEGQLYRMAASGGEAVRVSKGDEVSIWPWFLPDGDHFLFDVTIGAKPGIYVGSLSSEERKLVLPLPDISPSRMAYASGYLFYNRGQTLYAQQFDEKKLVLTGEPQKIGEHVEYYAPGRAAFSASAGGTLVYREAGEPIVAQLTLVDRKGNETGTVGPVAAYSDFTMSPDGRFLTFNRWADASVWILDIARGAETRIASERWAGAPAWMPDSRGVVFAAAIDTPPNLFMRRGDGSVERLLRSPMQQYSTDVTRDGRFVIAYVNDPVTGYDVVAVPTAPPHTPIPLVHSPFKERDGTASLDGKWLAYTSDENGPVQVYAMPMPGTSGSRVQISPRQGRIPRWSRDGRHLYYVDPEQEMMMEVSITVEGGELGPSVATPLFPYKHLDYDIAGDGRFLIANEKLNPDSPPMTVVMNWRAMLK